MRILQSVLEYLFVTAMGATAAYMMSTAVGEGVSDSFTETAELIRSTNQ